MKNIKFKGVTILLPVIDENKSLKKTLSIILRDKSNDIKKVIIILDKNKSLKTSIGMAKLLSTKNNKISIYFQKKPKLGGAFIDSMKLIKTSHSIIMSSDLETDPYTVKKMILLSKKYPRHIIQASRWNGNKNNFNDYGSIKLVFNYVFQKIFSILYKVNCNDLTFGYRLLPSIYLKKEKWVMNDHSFLLECVLKPIMRGAKIITISSNWKKRIEGKSYNQFSNYFRYLYIGILIFLTYKKNI
jgi:hypothetical protein|tara:strand:- start:2151 stop:2879 length:729 start_codon:yes stop_codon:yes gene_type:complete